MFVTKGLIWSSPYVFMYTGSTQAFFSNAVASLLYSWFSQENFMPIQVLEVLQSPNIVCDKNKQDLYFKTPGRLK